jgi:hypothetical protein
MVRRILRKFKILEISGCDRPAVEPARVAIFKRYNQGQTKMSDMEIAKHIEQTGELADTLLEIKTNEILARQPELSREQAYSKAYCDPASRELRVAEKRARDQRIMATAPQSAGVDASLSIAKRDRAMDQLNAKAEELRNLHPSLSPEQAFAKVYKLYPDLAKAERSAGRQALYA